MEVWYTLAGDITADSVRDVINWITNQFYSNKIKKIKFFISSNGGDIDSGVRLYDFLKATPAVIETYGFGQVDSAAILVFLSGSKRFALQNCRFRVHEGSYTGETVATSLSIHKEVLEFLKEISRRSIEIFAGETGSTSEAIEKMKTSGKILTAKEAQQIKLVHTIIDKLPLKKEDEK